MRRTLPILITALLLPGCVAWQSSFDDLERANARQFDELRQELAKSDGAIAEANRVFQEKLVEAVGAVRSETLDFAAELEKRVLGTVNDRISGLITAEEAEDLAAAAREEAVASQASQLEQLRKDVADAEKARIAEEAQARKDAEAAAKVAAAEAKVEAIRIAGENADKTKAMVAATAELAVSRILGSETGAKLVSDVIRDSGAVTEDRLASELPKAINEYRSQQGKDELDPSTAALIASIPGVLAALGLGVRKLTEEKRYAKKMAERSGQPPPAAG
ncbi:MAG: hypothetical protein DHS20C21_18070 [Gemmatimonadota bacterium]|nr:MAG: hypothetical protein DHS20C21_18070 [Gemmatimonadota bacterium]